MSNTRFGSKLKQPESRRSERTAAHESETIFPGRAHASTELLLHQLPRGTDRFTYERFDALQDQVAGDVARQILAELSDQFGVALVLLP